MKSDQVRELLERIFDDACGRGEMPSAEYQARKRDFVFHLTDCRRDLGRLADLLGDANPASIHDASVQLLSILYHVIPHLSTAGRLLLGKYADPFASDWPVEDSAEPSTTGKANKSKVSA